MSAPPAERAAARRAATDATQAAEAEASASPWLALHLLAAQSSLGDLMASEPRCWAPRGRLLTVRGRDACGAALAALAAARVLSAPALDDAGGLLGVADVRAALHAFLRAYGARATRKASLRSSGKQAVLARAFAMRCSF